MKVFETELQPNNANLTCYVQDLSPEMATADIRPAMLVFPGGGYYFCSDREAEPIALAYLAEGYNAFVLRYATGSDVPWQRSFEDAKASLAYLRDHAEELHIDPQKIAVAGFSAGGHLATALGTLGNDKPNALILGYPVTHEDMGVPVGKDIPGTDKAVTDNTPPAFLFATSNDNIVPIQNSLSFAAALADHNVFFEMHIYPIGEHGFSLGKAAHGNNDPGNVNPDAQAWFPASIRFLHHVFGDFMVGGKEQPGDLPSYHILNLDTPIKFLLRNENCVVALEKSLPGIVAILHATPVAYGVSLRQFSRWAPEMIPAEKLQELDSVFAANV